MQNIVKKAFQINSLVVWSSILMKHPLGSIEINEQFIAVHQVGTVRFTFK